MVIRKNIGHKCIADPEIPVEFLDFLSILKEKRKIVFVNCSEIGPKNDESWK